MIRLTASVARFQRSLTYGTCEGCLSWGDLDFRWIETNVAVRWAYLLDHFLFLRAALAHLANAGTSILARNRCMVL